MKTRRMVVWGILICLCFVMAGCGGTQEEELEVEFISRGSNILVAYFSTSDATGTVSKRLSELLGSDLYRITPVDDYSESDLNFRNAKSRAFLEMSDTRARPEMLGGSLNMTPYQTIFIGYPLWMGEAPRILNTFVETYDFTGKMIIPFCISEGADIGESGEHLSEMAGTGNWRAGERLRNDVSEEYLAVWVDSMGVPSQ